MTLDTIGMEQEQEEAVGGVRGVRRLRQEDEETIASVVSSAVDDGMPVATLLAAVKASPAILQAATDPSTAVTVFAPDDNVSDLDGCSAPSLSCLQSSSRPAPAVRQLIPAPHWLLLLPPLPNAGICCLPGRFRPDC